RSWLFSAFATADSRAFLTALAILFREKLSSAIALSTFLPRIAAATMLSFCGLTRRLRATATASVGFNDLLCLALLIALCLWRRCCRGRRSGGSRRPAAARRGRGRGLLVGRRVADEHTSRREL